MNTILKKIRKIYLINRVLSFLFKKLGVKAAYPKWPLQGNVTINILNQNVLFHSNCDDYLVSRYYYTGFDEEISEITALSKMIKDAKVFFDVGTFNGLFSIAIGKRYPDLNICAFEPNPANFARTNYNIAINKLKNIKTFNVGISDNKGKLDFFAPEDGSVTTVSSFDQSFFERHSNTTSSKKQVDIISMDSFCEQNNILPNFIKIDVEGHEMEVIKGAQRTIEIGKPIVLCEIFTKKFDTDKLFQAGLPKVYFIEEVFKKLNYNIFTIDNDKLIQVDSLNTHFDGRNFLFTPQ